MLQTPLRPLQAATTAKLPTQFVFAASNHCYYGGHCNRCAIRWTGGMATAAGSCSRAKIRGPLNNHGWRLWTVAMDSGARSHRCGCTLLAAAAHRQVPLQTSPYAAMCPPHPPHVPSVSPMSTTTAMFVAG
eukprot:GHVR01071974.1.p1 GENE.GHVR01071974.1~~GHVR01071974.1.p1  ORF type:complete len:131 (+),score=20.33 GHVR01071974.1:516-908(+)